MCERDSYKAEVQQEESEQKIIRDIDDLIFEGEIIKLHSEK